MKPCRLTSLIFATSTALVASSVSTFAASGTYTNTATGGTWNNIANWSSGAGPIADGAGFTADFSTLNITAANNVSLDVSRTLGTLKFGDTTGTSGWQITASGAARNITMDNTGGVGTASVDATVNVTFQNGAGAALTFNVGSNGFDKTGGGSMTINSDGNGSANWAGSGLVTVKGGALNLKQFAGNTSFTGNYQVDSGATLQLGVNNSGGALYGSGTAANSKTVTLNGGTLKTVRSTGNHFTLDQNINGIAAGSLVTVNNSSGANFTQVAGSVISGSTGFTMATATATATLNGTNTYTGVTSVTAGTLQVNGQIMLTNANVSGADLTTAVGATLNLDGTLKLASDLATIGNLGTFKLEDSSVLNLNGMFDTFNGGATGTYNLFSTLGTIDTSVASTFSSITGFNNSVWDSVTFNSANGQLAFTAVPEPSAALLGGLGALALLRRRRNL